MAPVDWETKHFRQWEAAVMRYFFNIRHKHRILDDEGVSYSCPNEMRSAALKTAGEMIATDMIEGSGRHWQMIVTDEDRHVVVEMNFSLDQFDRPERLRPATSLPDH